MTNKTTKWTLSKAPGCDIWEDMKNKAKSSFDAYFSDAEPDFDETKIMDYAMVIHDTNHELVKHLQNENIGNLTREDKYCMHKLSINLSGYEIRFNDLFPNEDPYINMPDIDCQRQCIRECIALLKEYSINDVKIVRILL